MAQPFDSTEQDLIDRIDTMDFMIEREDRKVSELVEKIKAYQKVKDKARKDLQKYREENGIKKSH
ncbi:hypothetical protein [Salinicoccus roseus]|uniref:Uncharacterized protein n=1 Tax=Salinicoccus roseus TaxID=45670 RepID=A0A265E6M1_9STAP|nr:hypothetical protein [Salinicoccus roseus]OZT77145.1 hypothetical protein CFN03_08705 [Salinicoccus roseus]